MTLGMVKLKSSLLCVNAIGVLLSYHATSRSLRYLLPPVLFSVPLLPHPEDSLMQSPPPPQPS